MQVLVAKTQKYITLVAFALIAAVVFLGYWNGLFVSFVGDDWIFYELAGRLSWADYLVKYFDPSAQTAWYRPLQGVLFKLAYETFGTNAVGYHFGNVFIHLLNCWLLYAVVIRAMNNRRVALVAALLYASFPTAVEGVFKPGVVDPLTTLCSLAAVWFWFGYLRGARNRDYWLTILFFGLALSSKEIAISLPFTLFLIDRLLARAPLTWQNFLRRYSWFAVLIAAYIPIEYIVMSRSVFVRREGYSASLSLVSNLLDYLGSLAFPWLLPSPMNYVWLALVAIVLAYWVIVRRVVALLPLIASAVLAVLPIIAFPFVTYRFGYLSLTSSAILFALAFDFGWRKFSARWATIALTIALALVVLIGSAGVSQAAIDFGEFARVMRVPFRNVSQAHPSFVKDTLLYFVNPPLPGPNLSGMFFWRYGTQVVVRADDMSARAALRDYPVAFVYVFDEQGNQKELAVDKNLSVQTTPRFPVDFSAPIQLQGYELVSANVKSGEPIVVFLYWRGLERIDKNYTVFAHLIDSTGKIVAEHDSEPRRGKAPTTAWLPGEQIIDVVQMSIVDVAPGTYRLAIGLYDAQSAVRISVFDSSGKDFGERIIIEPIRVTK